jgi:hypothetical protein
MLQSNSENNTFFYTLWNGYSSNISLFHSILFEKQFCFNKVECQILKNILVDSKNYQKGYLSTCEIDGCIVCYGNYGQILYVIYVECGEWQINVNKQKTYSQPLILSEMGFNKIQALLKR